MCICIYIYTYVYTQICNIHRGERKKRYPQIYAASAPVPKRHPPWPEHGPVTGGQVGT